MGTEIERKFLVNGLGWEKNAYRTIKQGYLCTDPDRTVRVRLLDSEAFITIKGRPQGITRAEYEYYIPTQDAQELLKMCVGHIIVKKRFIVQLQTTLWEVDQFEGAHKGLVIAEVELQSEQQQFHRPSWLGEEVSDDPKFTNSYLSQYAFSSPNR